MCHNIKYLNFINKKALFNTLRTIWFGLLIIGQVNKILFLKKDKK